MHLKLPCLSHTSNAKKYTVVYNRHLFTRKGMMFLSVQQFQFAFVKCQLPKKKLTVVMKFGEKKYIH